MNRFAIWGAGFFLLVALYWDVLMTAALITDTGDYKYDAIMGMLFVIGSLQLLSLSRKG